MIAVQAKDAECAAFKNQCLEGVAQAVAAKEALRNAEESNRAALEAAHAAKVAALEADIAALGTKEEAQAIRLEQEKAKLRTTLSEAAAQLAVLEARR